MDLYDDPDSPFVTAVLELPGLRRDDIMIQLQDEYLVIRADRRAYTPLASGTATRGAYRCPRSEHGHPSVAPAIHELQYGRIRRVIKLSQGIKVRTLDPVPSSKVSGARSDVSFRSRISKLPWLMVCCHWHGHAIPSRRSLPLKTSLPPDRIRRARRRLWL